VSDTLSIIRDSGAEVHFRDCAVKHSSLAEVVQLGVVGVWVYDSPYDNSMSLVRSFESWDEAIAFGAEYSTDIARAKRNLAETAVKMQQAIYAADAEIEKASNKRRVALEELERLKGST
jgi:biotin carboxylase